MELLRGALATAYPKRVVSRDLRDFADRKKPDLAAENRRLREELVRLRDEVSRALEVGP